MKALSARGAADRRAAPPTIYEVARRAGVSIATVSRVQRQSHLVAAPTRARVLRAVEELAYRPSLLGRSLARGRHEATGIVFPDLTGPYYSAVILGYEEQSAQQGRSVLILATHRRRASEELVLDLASRVDGLVLTGQTVSDRIVEELGHRSVPVVLLARPPIGDADSVRTESRHGAIELVAHLFEHGYRRLAFVGDPASSPDAAERWDGFRLAHRAAGRRPAYPPQRSGYREHDGNDAAGTLLATRRRPEAIVAANDEIAMGVLRAAREHGLRVPQDLAVTGWDDVPAAAHVAPPLTTVRQPMVELGRRAAQLLTERIDRARTDPRHEVLPTELVVRSSCGCRPEKEE
jgi:LacI family transcriptional regulator